MDTIMPNQEEARDLLQRAQQGDSEAFAGLLEPLRERLLASIRGRLNPAILQRVDPEDLLQDTTIRALHSLDRFEWQGDASFRRWIESIATHVALDTVRNQGRRRTLRIERDPTGQIVPPSRLARRAERLDRLNLAMESLSEDHRTVLELARMQGLTTREIATRMERSESSVKSLLFRATWKLKEAFGDTESLGLAARGDDDARDADGQ